MLRELELRIPLYYNVILGICPRVLLLTSHILFFLLYGGLVHGNTVLPLSE